MPNAVNNGDDRAVVVNYTGRPARDGDRLVPAVAPNPKSTPVEATGCSCPVIRLIRHDPTATPSAIPPLQVP